MPNLSLANYWHPMATSEEVVDQPKAFILLGERLVAFRDAEGVSVFKDLCIHRGAALSGGKIENGRLVCPYHGWAYDRSGAAYIFPRFHQTRRYRGALVQFPMPHGRPTASSGSR